MTTILLVEDDDILRDIIEFTLQGEGYDVVATGDSMAALDLLETRQIDLLMTDIVMPAGKPHGIAVARMARMKNRRVPLIVVTSDRISPRKATRCSPRYSSSRSTWINCWRRWLGCSGRKAYSVASTAAGSITAS
jgi:two-component system chemotaxis response regulator CheY